MPRPAPRFMRRGLVHWMTGRYASRGAVVLTKLKPAGTTPMIVKSRLSNVSVLPRTPGSEANLRFQKPARSEEHTSELQSQFHLVCRLLLEKKKKIGDGKWP